MIKLLAPFGNDPTFTAAVTCPKAVVIPAVPGIRFTAPLELSIIFDTALCAPGNPLSPVDALAGSVALTALTAFSAADTELVDVPNPVVTAFVTPSSPLVADEAAPEAILAASIPEFAAADFSTPATSLASVPDACTSAVALSAICFKFCGTPALRVGNPLVIASNAEPATPLALSNNPLNPPPSFVNPPNEFAIEPNPPVTTEVKLAAKLPEDIAPVTLPNIVLTAPPALPTIPETPPAPNAPDAVFK